MLVSEFLASPPNVHPCAPGSLYCMFGEGIDGTLWTLTMRCGTHGTERAPVAGERVTGWHPGAPEWYVVGYKKTEKALRAERRAARAKRPKDMMLDYFTFADRYRLP